MTGDILAMASYPTYDPNDFVGGISDAKFAALNDKAAFQPILNRAIQGRIRAGFDVQARHRIRRDDARPTRVPDAQFARHRRVPRPQGRPGLLPDPRQSVRKATRQDQEGNRRRVHVRAGSSIPIWPDTKDSTSRGRSRCRATRTSTRSPPTMTCAMISTRRPSSWRPSSSASGTTPAAACPARHKESCRRRTG